MQNFQKTYKGRVLICSPIPAPNGGWRTSLYIRESFGNEIRETRYTPDNGEIHDSPEKAAAVAEEYGKKLIDQAAAI